MATIELNDINNSAKNNLKEFIEKSENDYSAHIDALSDKLIKTSAKVILLAGPSSSGKTTTANLLADNLRSKGHPVSVISLDDFYLSHSDERYPLNDDGTPDYESPYSLDIEKIRETIKLIEKGGDVPLPKYDFTTGVRTDNKFIVNFPKDGYAIIEGLHALNPLLTEGIKPNTVLKVFVSVSTNILKQGEIILSGRKIRFVRRLSRDYLYRSASAKRTLAFWNGVLKGEDLFLYPFKEQADYCFDTFHPYELCTLKNLALDILNKDENLGEYAEKIKNALTLFEDISISEVPKNSLIREFIPGGIYENLYK